MLTYREYLYTLVMDALLGWSHSIDKIARALGPTFALDAAHVVAEDVVEVFIQEEAEPETATLFVTLCEN